MTEFRDQPIRIAFEPVHACRSLSLRSRSSTPTSGHPMAVDHVHFEISINGQMVSGPLEGDPVGTFSASGTGFYKASAALPSAGSYEVELLVKHRESSFTSNWPLEVTE